jgi:PEP-CTERM motif
MTSRGTISVGLVSAVITAMCSMAVAGPVANETGPNLVTNGSFENTSQIAGSGWTVSGFIAEGFDYFIDTNPSGAQSGTHSFAGGAIGDLGFISQNIATTVGDSYNIHVWLANLSGFADSTAIEVLWGGNLVYSATDILGFGYHEIVIDPIATSASTELSIGLRDDSFFLNVDNISVHNTSVSQTPEPATLALLLGGLGAAGFSIRRRRTI